LMGRKNLLRLPLINMGIQMFLDNSPGGALQFIMFVSQLHVLSSFLSFFSSGVRHNRRLFRMGKPDMTADQRRSLLIFDPYVVLLRVVRVALTAGGNGAARVQRF